MGDVANDRGDELTVFIEIHGDLTRGGVHHQVEALLYQWVKSSEHTNGPKQSANQSGIRLRKQKSSNDRTNAIPEGR